MSVARTPSGMVVRLAAALALVHLAACQQTVKAYPDSLVGVGIVVKTSEAGHRITEVFSGSPAEHAGLAVGDNLLSVDGQPTAGRTLASVVGSLRGKPGTQVVVRVGRMRGDVTVTLTREQLIKRGNDYRVE